MILFSDPAKQRRKGERAPFARASRMHWHRFRSPDASYPRFPTPSASPVVVVVDDAIHLVAPRRRRRMAAVAAFTRDRRSWMEFSRHRPYKRIVTNLVLPFSLCAARQNGLDHRRRSGISRPRPIATRSLLLRRRVWSAMILNWGTSVISVNVNIYNVGDDHTYFFLVICEHTLHFNSPKLQWFRCVCFFFVFYLVAWIFGFRLRMHTRCYVYSNRVLKILSA